MLGICFNIFVLYFHVIDSHVNYNDYEGETVGDVWCWLTWVDLEEGALNNLILLLFLFCIPSETGSRRNNNFLLCRL